MRRRTLSRELALQLLYRLGFHPEINTLNVNEFWEDTINSFNTLFSRKNEKPPEYAKEIVNGYLKNQSQINKVIKDSSANWDFQRITLIDRAILQISIYELLYRDDIPHAVSINEAIELAKKYGGTNSSNFVNGILNKIATEKN